MNPRLPPDIDRLLWEVAESQDPSAFDDFESRFPQLVVELGKRIKLVRELRDARSSGDVQKPHPSFDRRQPAPSFRLTPALAGIGAVALAALGFGAYELTSHAVNKPSDDIGQPAPTVSTAPLPLPNQPISVVPTPTPTQIQQTPKPEDQVNNTPSVQATPEYLKPRDFSVDRERLKVAIQALGESGGLSIEFAPNTPNPEIRMRYQAMSSLDILKDLGVRFGFTAFDQGNHLVLIVPTRDPASTDRPSPTGTAENLDDQTASPENPPEIGAKKVKPAKATTPT